MFLNFTVFCSMSSVFVSFYFDLATLVVVIGFLLKCLVAVISIFVLISTYLLEFRGMSQ